MMKYAFINGNFIEETNASISIFDRGFLFGDAIYEVLPVYNGRPFFLEKHLERLFSNLDKIKIPIPSYPFEEIIDQLIRKNGGDTMQVYLQITRGNQGIRKHDIPDSLEPTVVAFTLHNKFPSLEDKEKGMSAKLIEDFRWSRCDIKTTSLLANIMINHEAVSAGYLTSIMVRDGYITEGSTCNVFIVDSNDLIVTPPLNNLCLPGITRNIVLELIQKSNLKYTEANITIDDLYSAKEVWITSTTKEIFPIVTVNDKPINKGIIGGTWRILNNQFQQLLTKA
ncbi:D-amino acid aminotransferase [Legionella waltersii]|uniref:Aminodeoxychorismate lyase n=1 Tax=Legionella waltersii TaxID=66969 RepID=A0A0W1A1S9_9GAMM|nr:D-amino acid aminotransferase [Legionella waltersii]KTD75088.1 D-alanine-aminotransferase [Legionella waltersii]SNV05175.1 D-alanine transaminase [Legionella waltersii]